MRDFMGVLLATLASVLVLSGPVAATPAKEAPWLPEAAAYRLTLFLGNLEPGTTSRQPGQSRTAVRNSRPVRWSGWTAKAISRLMVSWTP